MTTIDTFPARSKLACCATCAAWGLRTDNQGRQEPYCPVLSIFLPEQDFTAIGCAEWRQERYESYAVETWRKLVQSGAT